MKAPTRHDGRAWVTVYVCERCGETYTHVELSPYDDEPHGLSFGARWCECGGFLIGRTPDYDSGCRGC